MTVGPNSYEAAFEIWWGHRYNGMAKPNEITKHEALQAWIAASQQCGPNDRQKSAGFCMYCGNVFHANDTSNEEVARVYAEAIAHDQQCPSNPLVKKLAALSAIAPTTSPSAARNRHIEGFRALNDNWNSYGSEKLPEETIQLGLRVSNLLNDEWKVIPCADGPSIWFYRGDEDEIIQVWASASTDGTSHD